MAADYASIGFTLGKHPLSLIRKQLTARLSLSSADLAKALYGKRVRFAGVVRMRQLPETASGVPFVGFWQAQDASQLRPDSLDDLNCLRFRSALFRPAGVFGPVLNPPCHLHRGRPGAHIALQGQPSERRFAPQRLRTKILMAHSYIFNFFLYSALLTPKSFARAGEG